MRQKIRNIRQIINRYFRVYGMLCRLNAAQLFSYRANLLNSLVSHTVWSVFLIISMMLLTSKAPHIFGWTRNELLLFAGTYNVIFSIFYFFFQRNFNEFSNTIHLGRLDAILIKPIDAQFFMTSWNVSYAHTIRFIIGLSFLIFMLIQMHAQITVLTVVGFIFLLILSIIILYSFWLMVMTLSLWFTKLSNLPNLLYSVHSVTRFPPEMYKGASTYLLYAIFPLTLVVVVPAKALLQKIFLGDVIWPIVFAIGMFYLSRKFWLFALRYYTSASG